MELHRATCQCFMSSCVQNLQKVFCPPKTFERKQKKNKTKQNKNPNAKLDSNEKPF